MTDDHLKALGKVTVNFGQLELLLGTVVMALAGFSASDQLPGQVLMTHLPFGKRVAAIGALVRLRHPQHLDECLKLLTPIKQAEARRNQIIHAAWEEGDAHEAVRIKITANGALTHQAEAVTADDLLELAKELERAAGNFVKFAAGAKMLGAFHSPA